MSEAQAAPFVSRGERRREKKARERARALRHRLIDPTCPDDLLKDIHARLAAGIARQRFEFHPGETVQSVFARELADLFALAERNGFVLSFDLPENSPQALRMGFILYSIKRARLN
jgi:hypothetical protein